MNVQKQVVINHSSKVQKSYVICIMPRPIYIPNFKSVHVSPKSREKVRKTKFHKGQHITRFKVCQARQDSNLICTMSCQTHIPIESQYLFKKAEKDLKNLSVTDRLTDGQTNGQQMKLGD